MQRYDVWVPAALRRGTSREGGSQTRDNPVRATAIGGCPSQPPIPNFQNHSKGGVGTARRGKNQDSGRMHEDRSVAAEDLQRDEGEEAEPRALEARESRCESCRRDQSHCRLGSPSPGLITLVTRSVFPAFGGHCGEASPSNEAALRHGSPGSPRSRSNHIADLEVQARGS